MSKSHNYRVGADIGGTFTDIVLIESASGRIVNLKVPTSVESPAKSVDLGIAEMLATTSLEAVDCEWLAHGQTIALNAVLTRRGAKVGLITTQGFGDVLEIDRARLPDPFDFNTQRTPALVRRNYVREVVERLSATGEVLVELDPTSLREAVDELVHDMQVERIVVAFLHSYAHPTHEDLACQMIRKWYPDIKVEGSAQVWSQAREFERVMVAAVNAYVGPGLESYISRLEDALESRGIAAELLICTSNGGVVTSELATQRPVSTLLSGPAAGIVAAHFLQAEADLGNVITLDMGGTSADMAVLAGDLPYTREQELEGLPIAIPCLDVSSIGAGGGSIALVDDFGVLKVGPHSVGADPGPAAYGRGGTSATITDAYVSTGLIDPDSFLGGKYELKRDLADNVIGQLASQLNLSVPQTAEGILRVATANLAREFTRLTARHGADARQFTLLAFGGAGPTHACFLADEMGIGSVAFPLTPGTFSALGTLAADFRLDYIKTVYKEFSAVPVDDIERWYRDVEDEGTRALAGQRGGIHSITVERAANLRFHLQGYDMNVAFDDVTDLDSAFREKYADIYGHVETAAPLDLISLEASVVGHVNKPLLAEIAPVPAGEAVDVSPAHHRKVFLGGQWQQIPVYVRRDLKAGQVFGGPAIVSQEDTTCVVTQHWQAEVDRFGTIILTREERS